MPKPRSSHPVAYASYVGKQFGRLIVERVFYKEVGKKHPGQRTYAGCRCLCGARRGVFIHDLIAGKTKSCGCLSREVTASRATIHGHATGGHKTARKLAPEYIAWQAMKSRCSCPLRADWHRYGGRGIKVCSKWKDSFEAFLRDMGSKPFRGATLDRIDNNGDYCPENCRWASRPQQSRNTSRNHRVVYRGASYCVADLVPVAAVPKATLRSRLLSGWDVERAVHTPPRASRPL